jgi:hypothetical protein
LLDRWTGSSWDLWSPENALLHSLLHFLQGHKGVGRAEDVSVMLNRPGGVLVGQPDKSCLASSLSSLQPRVSLLQLLLYLLQVRGRR